MITKTLLRFNGLKLGFYALMAITDDRKFIHDIRNSIMVIRNLSELLQQEKLKGADKEQAYALIKSECEKVLQMCVKKE